MLRVNKARLGLGVAGTEVGLGIVVEVRLEVGISEGVGEGIVVGSRATMTGLGVGEEAGVEVSRSPTTLSVATR